MSRDCASQRWGGLGGAPGLDTMWRTGAWIQPGDSPQPHHLVASGLPHGSLCTPMSRGHAVALKDGGSGLTLVLPGTTHVLRHPAHGAEQGGQVGAGHLAADEVLQLGAPRPQPPGGPGLQVLDLGFEGLGEGRQGGTRWRGGDKGEGKGAPGVSPPRRTPTSTAADSGQTCWAGFVAGTWVSSHLCDVAQWAP